jgi:hypothetical protein
LSTSQAPAPGHHHHHQQHHIVIILLLLIDSIHVHYIPTVLATQSTGALKSLPGIIHPMPEWDLSSTDMCAHIMPGFSHYMLPRIMSSIQWCAVASTHGCCPGSVFRLQPELGTAHPHLPCRLSKLYASTVPSHTKRATMLVPSSHVSHCLGDAVRAAGHLMLPTCAHDYSGSQIWYRLIVFDASLLNPCLACTVGIV